MDGKGAWRDKVFVERLWRRVTYEEIDLHADANLPEARASIGRYLAFYNSTRPHASLGGQTPDQAYIQRAAANPGSGLTQTEIHLAMAPTLFKQSEPPLASEIRERIEYLFFIPFHSLVTKTVTQLSMTQNHLHI